MEENVTECNSAKNQEPTGRREALNYLEGLHKNYAAYHGQKETLGWAGIALFATLVPVLFTQLPNTESITHKLLATTTILVLTISVLRYINTQTRLRHKAADFVAASLALQTEIVSGSMETIDFSASDNEDNEHQSTHVLPDIFLAKADSLSGKGGASGTRRDTSARILILTISIIGLVWIWVPL